MGYSLEILSLIAEIPFSFEEMREYSCSERSKLVENIRKQSSVMYLEVETGFIGKSHNLFENKPHRFDKEWIDKRVNDFCVFISGMLIKNDLVLNEKV